jgi:hypothetical protein
MSREEETLGRQREDGWSPRLRAATNAAVVAAGLTIVAVSACRGHAQAPEPSPSEGAFPTPHAVEVVNDMDYDVTELQWYV